MPSVVEMDIFWNHPINNRHLLKVEPTINQKLSNLSAKNFKKTRNLDGLTPAPAIPSCDTGQQMPCFDSFQMTTK